jgi:hypothetical protein
VITMSEVYEQQKKRENDQKKRIEITDDHDIRLGISEPDGLLKLACKTHAGAKRADCEAAEKVVRKEIAFQLGIKAWDDE